MGGSTTEEPRVEGGGRLRAIGNAIVREVRTHPFGYAVLGVFVVASPFVVAWLFPQAPPAVAAVGGLVFAVYAALCAVPQKFL